MYVTLSTGQEIRLHVSHKTFKTKRGERRGTEVKLVVKGKIFKSKAVCSPGDNFSKKMGRKLAAQKLIGRWKEFFTTGLNKTLYEVLSDKMDRAKIFDAINPNLIPKKKRKA